MTPHEFQGYGVNSRNVTVILERITHWWLIDYNGNYGTEIELDTGKSVRVGCYPAEVENTVRSALRRGAEP